ncbi:MAG: 1-acyl-sn-glycerol-3-phosphate acyltransferase [Alphaproteobacteria bacterium]|nr:1-acyl-sn-glycerol-3-phosphate acyltransferase [Alphaproteobacteria bacterium]
MRVLAALRSLIFMIVFYAVSVVIVLLTVPVAAFGRPALRRHVLGWVVFHSWCCRWILGIRTRIEGEIPAEPVLFAAKHQAMYETLDLVRILDEPAVVMKRQLADIPVFGWATRRYGGIAIDRSGGAAALRAMMREADMALAERRAILIFPEGTRVLPGERPPLQPGFAGLYRRLGLPVVPVALDSGRVFPRGWIKGSGPVTMRFGAPIPPGLPRKEVEKRVHDAINALETAA